MKKNFTVLGTIMLIGLFVYFVWIRPDYSWADRVITSKQKDDWILIAKMSSSDLFKPWTLFKPPLTDLWFAKKNDLMRLDSLTMVGHIFHSSHDEYANDKEYYEVFNCSDLSSYILNKPEELETFDRSTVDWYKYRKGSPGEEALKYFCSKNRKYTMLNVFGEDIDISNYIINGMYSLKDTSSKYIYVIINNNPYNPTENDEKVIRDGITKWLNEKYPNNTFSLESNLYQKVKYKSCRMQFDRPIDDYLIEINPNQKIGKLVLEFDFTRFSIPPEYKIADGIRIHNEIDAETR